MIFASALSVQKLFTFLIDVKPDVRCYSSFIKKVGIQRKLYGFKLSKAQKGRGCYKLETDKFQWKIG